MAESQQMLVETSEDYVSTDFFDRFESGEFDVANKEHFEQQRMFEDTELQALPDE